MQVNNAINNMITLGALHNTKLLAPSCHGCGAQMEPGTFSREQQSEDKCAEMKGLVCETALVPGVIALPTGCKVVGG